MGYTPTLIINKKELDSKRKILESEEVYDDGQAKFLMNLINQEGFTIGGLKLVICETHTTRFNELIRDKLFELNVEYAEDY